MGLLRSGALRQRGFSLIEVLIVLAVIAILVGIGASRMDRSRFAVNQASEGLARDYQALRLEAIRLNEFVGIHVDPGTDEYLVFVDLNRNLAFDEGVDTIVKTVNLGNDGVGVDSTNMDALLFDPRGLNPTPFVSELAVQLNNVAGTYPRTVCVGSQGRSRVVTAAGCA